MSPRAGTASRCAPNDRLDPSTHHSQRGGLPDLVMEARSAADRQKRSTPLDVRLRDDAVLLVMVHPKPKLLPLTLIPNP